jgi:hypothetical protein
VPPGDGVDATAVDQPADLFGDDIGRSARVDVDELHPTARDSVARVELFDRELSAGQAGWAVDPGRTLPRHDKGDRDLL